MKKLWYFLFLLLMIGCKGIYIDRIEPIDMSKNYLINYDSLFGGFDQYFEKSFITSDLRVLNENYYSALDFLQKPPQLYTNFKIIDYSGHTAPIYNEGEYRFAATVIKLWFLSSHEYEAELYVIINGQEYRMESSYGDIFEDRLEEFRLNIPFELIDCINPDGVLHYTFKLIIQTNDWYRCGEYYCKKELYKSFLSNIANIPFLSEPPYLALNFDCNYLEGQMRMSRISPNFDTIYYQYRVWDMNQWSREDMNTGFISHLEINSITNRTVQIDTIKLTNCSLVGAANNPIESYCPLLWISHDELPIILTNCDQTKIAFVFTTTIQHLLFWAWFDGVFWDYEIDGSCPECDIQNFVIKVNIQFWEIWHSG